MTNDIEWLADGIELYSCAKCDVYPEWCDSCDVREKAIEQAKQILKGLKERGYVKIPKEWRVMVYWNYCSQHGYPLPCYKCGAPTSLIELEDALERVSHMHPQGGQQDMLKAGWVKERRV